MEQKTEISVQDQTVWCGTEAGDERASLQVLSTTYVAEQGGEYGCRFRRDVKPVDAYLCGGLLGIEIVRCMMRGEDISLKRCGEPLNKLPDIQPLCLSGADRELAARLSTILPAHAIGFDGHHDAMDEAKVILDIVRIFIGALIVVIVLSAADETALVSWFARLGLRATRASDADDSKDYPILVGTAVSFARLNQNLRASHFVVVIDPQRFTSREFDDLLALLTDQRFRLIGLHNLSRRIPINQRELVFAAFGPVTHSLPRPGHMRRPIRLVRIKVDSPVVTQGDVLSDKRNGIWNHPTRNRRLCHAAKVFATGDAAGSSRLGLKNPITGPQRVLVVCEGQDHLRVLRRLLPGWPTIEGETGMQSHQHGLVTMTTLQTMQLDDVDVIVWAAGGWACPPIPLQGLSMAEPRELLVVDVDDRQSPQLRKWSRKRLQACRETGWIYQMEEPYLEQAVAFLEKQDRLRAQHESI